MFYDQIVNIFASLPELRLPPGLPAQLAQALALLWEILARLLRGESLFAVPTIRAAAPRRAPAAPPATAHPREDGLSRFLRGGKLRRRAQLGAAEREGEDCAVPAARRSRAGHAPRDTTLPAARPRAAPGSAARAPPDNEN